MINNPDPDGGEGQANHGVHVPKDSTRFWGDISDTDPHSTQKAEDVQLILCRQRVVLIYVVTDHWTNSYLYSFAKKGSVSDYSYVDL